MNPLPLQFCTTRSQAVFSTGTISMPTFPNYRLDSGPVCDPTITTSSKDIADVPILNVMVYPNPTSAAFFVESAYQYRNAEIRILDTHAGRNRWQGQHERILALHADMLEDGVYIVQLMNDHRVLAKEKLVVVRWFYLNHEHQVEMIIDLLESDYFSKLHLLICLLIIIKASTYMKNYRLLYLFCSIKLNSQKSTTMFGCGVDIDLIQ